MSVQQAAAAAESTEQQAGFPDEGSGAPTAQFPSDSEQFTVRAVVTGMVLGGTLSMCNLYAGLKVGWGFNMSLTAALLGLGFWKSVGLVTRGRPFGMLENNINQTAASAGAYISSAGLVSAIPALTALTGRTLSWAELTVWMFSICGVGIVVAISLRRQMLLVDKLPFASGIAAAETLREMYAKGAEASARIKMLISGALFAAGLKIVDAIAALPKLGLPGSVPIREEGAARSPSLYNLGFALDPSLLLFAVGGIVGPRIGVSLLIGAIIGWGVMTPYAFAQGWAKTGAADGMWYSSGLQWLLWPGVAMMVTAALTSFAFSWKSVAAALKGGRSAAGAESGGSEGDVVSRAWLLRGLAVSGSAAVVLQILLFDIAFHVAVMGVLFTFLLAVVAARVTGETAITPVGPMGKVTQLLFGVIAPGDPAANLMTANVTGGAASQCGDLLHDLKTGHLIGASARLQAMAQVLGALAGALVASAVYLVLMPNPKEQLFTTEWPAPAAAAWMAVAKVFQQGFSAMPAGAVDAMAIFGGAGIVLAVLEKIAPKKARTWIPSPASIGLALVIPAYNSISMFLGGCVAVIAGRFAKTWSGRFLIVLASGIIAGESLTGVGVAIVKMVNAP